MAAPTRSPGDDLGRFTVPSETVPEPVERFTIRSVPTGSTTAELLLEWERTRIRLPIEAAKP